ncbi:MAG TPA: hypothetical protein VJR23_16340 [Candidatus Acidoferrales bacterium]|nr:hypothetical protein [Candidatus Acidoferrales bacterium]
MTEMKDVGLRVGHFPFFGEIGGEVEMVVALEETVEEEEVDMRGEGVGADARIEIGGHGFEEEVDGGGSTGGAMGAAGYEEAKKKSEQQISAAAGKPHADCLLHANWFGMTGEKSEKQVPHRDPRAALDGDIGAACARLGSG